MGKIMFYGVNSISIEDVEWLIDVSVRVDTPKHIALRCNDRDYLLTVDPIGLIDIRCDEHEKEYIDRWELNRTACLQEHKIARGIRKREKASFARSYIARLGLHYEMIGY